VTSQEKLREDKEQRQQSWDSAAVCPRFVEGVVCWAAWRESLGKKLKGLFLNQVAAPFSFADISVRTGSKKEDGW